MTSSTYGEVSISEIARIIMGIVGTEYDQYSILVGTDSMSYADTRVATVIALYHIGKGGIFFYDVETCKRMSTIREKITYETQKSMEYSNELLSELDALYSEFGFDYSNIKFSIHVDAGYTGDTRKVVSEIVSWINSCGYDCEIKPNAPIASTVADKISK